MKVSKPEHAVTIAFTKREADIMVNAALCYQTSQELALHHPNPKDANSVLNEFIEKVRGANP